MPHNKDGELDLTAVAPASIVNVNDSFFARSPDESYKKISWRGHKRNIFETSPTMDDIHQSGIGDCYLLVALLSIVRYTPEAILSMMKDERKGHVVVRLYKKDKTPVYYRLQKTFLKSKEANLASHNAYWVYMLEKAVAAFRSIEKGVPEGEALNGYYSQVEVLEGGSPADMYELLLGKNSRTYQTENVKLNDQLNLEFISLSLLRTTSIHRTHTRKDILERIFGTASNVSAINFIKEFTYNGGVEAPVGIFKDQGEIRLEKVMNFIKQHSTPAMQQETLGKIQTHFGKGFPGKRGTGQYTSIQIDLFNKLELATKNNVYVAVSSKNDVAPRVPAVLEGEKPDTYHGLVSEHVYEVFDTSSDPWAKYIHIRNPWRQTGRSYRWRFHDRTNQFVLHAVETKEGDFKLELSDLTKRFDKVYFGGTQQQLQGY